MSTWMSRTFVLILLSSAPYASPFTAFSPFLRHKARSVGINPLWETKEQDLDEVLQRVDEVRIA